MDVITAEVLRTGDWTLNSKILKLIWSNKELDQPWEKSVTAFSFIKGKQNWLHTFPKTVPLSARYRMLSSNLLATLIIFINELIGDHHYRLWLSSSTTDVREELYRMVK
jgi:hypothetical protein